MVMRQLVLLLLVSVVADAAEIRVPAHTAYLKPDAGGARVSAQDGVTHWNDNSTSVLWFGQLKQTGTLSVSVDMVMPEGQGGKFALDVIPPVDDHSEPGFNEVVLTSTFQDTGKGVTHLDFGKLTISKPGYKVFRLRWGQFEGKVAGNVQTLILDGPPAEDAHFNLKPRRNAASVHLAYPVDRNTKVSAFYCEMTGLEDPLWSYYMACGWHRGYFGMQVNSPTERRIIFSVWDSGGEAVDRRKVGDENRVKLVAKGDGVYSGDFGNEGTGGHSHLKYW